MTNKKKTDTIYHHKPLGLLKLYLSPKQQVFYSVCWVHHMRIENFIPSLTSPGANEVTKWLVILRIFKSRQGSVLMIRDYMTICIGDDN